MENIKVPTQNQSRISEQRGPERLCYTVKEAAIALNVSEKTIRRLLDRGLLKSSLALRKKLIPRQCLENFFQATS